MKSSGETKLLLLMALFVLLGGGALLGLNKVGGGGTTPTPPPTPPPFAWTKETFDAMVKKARHVRGDAGARLTVVEFADFQCPSCRRAYNAVVEKMIKERPVRFAFVHCPLPMHENAIPAAVATEAADKQGKFWEMYSALFRGEETDPDLSETAIEKAAKSVGLNVEQFKKDIKDPALAKLVTSDKQLAETHNVESTPTFVVDDGSGKIRQAIGGKELEAVLAEAPVGAPPPAIRTGAASGTTAPGTRAGGVGAGDVKAGGVGAAKSDPPAPASTPSPSGVISAPDR